MEKSSSVKPKNRFLKLAASAVTFQNPPFSPSKEKRSSNAMHNIRKGFSGPMISIIPAEARYKSRSSSFAAHEPTSPKISCMGQIKQKKKMCSLNKQNRLPPRDHQSVSHSTPLEQVDNSKKAKVLKSTQSFAEVKKTNPQRVLNSAQSFNEGKKKKTFVIRNIFAKAAVKKGDHSVDGAPSLGQLQRFSSGRNSLSNFDWTAAQIAPDDDRNYHSDEERESDREEEEEEEDCKIGFSAPMIMIGGCKGVELEPRKEINLWKRRTMAQPKPLQLNTKN